LDFGLLDNCILGQTRQKSDNPKSNFQNEPKLRNFKKNSQGSARELEEFKRARLHAMAHHLQQNYPYEEENASIYLSAFMGYLKRYHEKDIVDILLKDGASLHHSIEVAYVLLTPNTTYTFNT
jgi:hypothetical protein